MASGRVRRALGAVKDQTSIGLAKSDLEVAIVKATRHDEQPAEERHIREVLRLSSCSPGHVGACVASISRRLGRTRSWEVALKSLVLVHRLLSEGDPAYEREVFFATRRGTRLLNMSDFRDASGSGSGGSAWDFSAFVRTFALYLDERLEFRVQHCRRTRRRGWGGPAWDEDNPGATPPPPRSTPLREMKPELVFRRAQHLQRQLERFLSCRPTGAAKNHRIVAAALHPLLKESHQLYFDITDAMDVLVERFMELEVDECVRVHDAFARLSNQLDELSLFCRWCNKAGLARPSDCPEVEKIPAKRLQAMEGLIRDKRLLVSGKLEDLDSPREEPQPATEDQQRDPMIPLPAPETTTEPEDAEQEEEAARGEETTETTSEAAVKAEEEEADFLNLREEAAKPEEHGEMLALALFDGGAGAEAAPMWEAFPADGSPEDWETALVESASTLCSQKASLGGGFDQLLLDGLYQHQPAQPAAAAAFTGSASSMVLPQGQPVMALPAPAPVQGGGSAGLQGVDPFTASLGVAAPAYVQMSEMEKKQQLLVEEQFMWRQYVQDGMQLQQGQLGVGMQLQLHANPYHMGGYPHGH